MSLNENKISWNDQQANAIKYMKDAGGAPGTAKPEAIYSKNGREVLEAMMEGKLPYPSMNDTLNLALIEVSKGLAVFQGIPLAEHYNPMGTVHGGWFASLLDSALGCAVQSSLPVGQTYTTAELNIKIIKAATHKTGPLRAIGKLIHRGNRLATAEARIEDEQGKLYAHATTTCLVFEIPKARD